MTNEELTVFLQKVADVVPAYTETDKFCFFDFFKIDEMRMSKILAFLLNPSESHGQGPLFLNALISYLNEKKKSLNFEMDPFPDVEIEKDIKQYGRLDVLIRGRNSILIIENKSHGASDQKLQLQSYANWLTEEFPNYKKAIVYLSEKKPDSYTLGRNKCTENLTIHLTLRELWNEILTPTSSKVEANSPIQIFLQNLILYTIHNCCEFQMSDNNLLEIISQTPNSLKAIFAIHDQFGQLLKVAQSQFVLNLRDQLTKKLGSEISDQISINICNSKHGYGGIEFRFNHLNWALTLESNNFDLEHVFWNLRFDEGFSNESKVQLCHEFEHIFRKTDGTSTNFPWWNRVHYPQSGCWATPEIIDEMLSPNETKLSIYILKNIKGTFEHFALLP